MPLPDKDSLSGTFGGPYGNQHPTEDPSTEMDCDLGNAELCDVAMMTHMVPRATVLWTGAAYSGSGTDLIVPNDHEALWGSGTSVRPTVGQTATGVWVVTWTATQLDELGDSHTLNIRFPDAVAYGVSTLIAKVISWTANTITINTYSSGALNGLSGTKIKVWWT